MTGSYHIGQYSYRCSVFSVIFTILLTSIRCSYVLFHVRDCVIFLNQTVKAHLHGTLDMLCSLNPGNFFLVLCRLNRYTNPKCRCGQQCEWCSQLLQS